MGFTQNIDIIISKRQRQQQEKEQQQQQKEEKKQYESDIKKSLLIDLQNEFLKQFETLGSQAVYYYYNIENQNNIINLIGSNLFEKEYIQENYNKILNKVYKKYVNHEKAKAIDNIKYNETISANKQNINKFNLIVYITIKIIKKVLFIIIGFIIFVLAVIFGLATKSK